LTKNTSNQYRWASIAGTNNQPNGTGSVQSWSNEDTSRTGAFQIDDYTIDWCNVRVLFKGAMSRPSNIDFDVVTFPDKAGPNRTYNQSGVYQEDVDPTGDEENENTSFWDHYLAPRTQHPLRTSMLSTSAFSKPMIRKSHKRISIAPVAEAQEVNEDITTSSTATGALPFMHCENMFIRMNRTIKCRSDLPNVTASATIVGGTTPAFVANNTTSQASLFQMRDKDQWLFISAINYNRFAAAGTAESPESYRFDPSFDIVVRRKISWNQDT
jgi:hypothetical protein